MSSSPNYAYIFVIAFMGMLIIIVIFSILKQLKLKKTGGVILPQRLQETPGNEQFVFRDDKEPEFMIPKEVKLYEFYCFTCKRKYIGYQVFCPTCGERMKLYEPSLTLVPPVRQKENNQIKCILCYKSICPTCNAQINGENSCFEECPYCESIYHKHCWDKTMNSFGKCGFCLEIPPSELIPNDFKD